MNLPELLHSLFELKKSNDAGANALGEALWLESKCNDLVLEKTAVAADDTANHKRLDDEIKQLKDEQAALLNSKVFSDPLMFLPSVGGHHATVRSLYGEVLGFGQPVLDGAIRQDFGFGKFAPPTGGHAPLLSLEERVKAVEQHIAAQKAAAAPPESTALAPHSGSVN